MNAAYDKLTREIKSKDAFGAGFKESSDDEASRLNIRGKDVLINIYLTLEEAYFGGRKTIRYGRKVQCLDCRGKYNPASQKAGFNLTVCSACQGAGVIVRQISVEIDFPAGVRAGDNLSREGLGHWAAGGCGDLRVNFLFKNHNYFTVQGNDLQYNGLVGLDLFIEGGSLRVPTLNGAETIVVPARFPNGWTTRLPGRGLPASKNLPRGDIIVRVDLCVPKKLSRKEHTIVNELLTLPGFRPPIDENGFIKRGD